MSTDVYTIVTERVIALLEAGTAPWRKTWRGGGSPRNLISKRKYRGINAMLLGTTSFASPYWLTFNQVKTLGGRVKKGSKSELVIFWKFPEKVQEIDKAESDSTEHSSSRRRPPIQHDDSRAYYAPIADYVNLPRPETFDTPENYYAVAFHELTHSTGHESRLNREGVAGRRLAAFGSADYSCEELVAELGSLFLGKTTQTSLKSHRI